MNAAELLNTLEMQGIQVIPDGQNLRVRGRLDDNMRKMIKALKVEIREQLNTLPGSNVVSIRPANDSGRQISDDWAYFDQLATEQGREEIRLMHRRKVPAGYTATFECKHCGTVPVKPRTTNCTWCFVGGYRGGK